MSDKPKTGHGDRRGRRPLGARALTAAERVRKSRERLTQRGSIEVSMRIDRKYVEWLDAVARASGQTRSQAIQAVLEAAVERMKATQDRLAEMIEQGASDAEVFRANAELTLGPILRGPLTDEQLAMIRKEVDET